MRQKRMTGTASILGVMTNRSDDFPVLVIDGANISDLDGFAREFSRLLCGHTWRGNLDAFNDLLRGGFGTPENGWVLKWLNLSRPGPRSATRRQSAGWSGFGSSDLAPSAGLEDQLVLVVESLPVGMHEAVPAGGQPAP